MVVTSPDLARRILVNKASCYQRKSRSYGVLRILIETPLPLDVAALVADSAAGFKPALLTAPGFEAQLLDFMFERLRNLLRDAGHAVDIVDAVLALRPLRMDLVPAKLDAVRTFRGLPEAEALAAANKRIVNILKKAEGDVKPQVSEALLVEAAEKTLGDALKAVAPQADAAFAGGDYTRSLQALAALKGPVDAFFDSVMVNAEDPALKANRLGLLATLHAAMNRVADLSRLAA